MTLTWLGRLLLMLALCAIAAPASAQGVEQARRFEPVVDGRRAYIAQRSDLLTVDLDTDTVIERRRFPGVIDAMVSNGDGYTLTLLARALMVDEPDPDSAIDVRYRPGDPTPGSGLFEAPLVLTSSDAALELVGVEDPSQLETLSPKQAEEAIVRLRAAEKRDLSNLFLPLYRGRIAQLSGRGSSQEKESPEETPSAIYQRAAQIKDAPWSDDLLATFLLIKYGQDQLSEEFAARAKQKMQERGLQVERLNGIELQVGLSTELRESLREGIHGNDIERIDYLQGRIAEFFPHSEQSLLTWRWVADWMDANKRPKLAQVWRGRAAKASHAPLVGLNESSGRKADRATLLWTALAISLILIPLGIGLRRPRQRLSKEAGSRSRIARLDINMWDGIGFLALVLGCSILPAVIQKHTTVSATLESAPSELFDTAYDSPKVLTWLESLAESEGRSAWVGYAEKAQDALRAGTRVQAAPPSEQLLADAISAGPGASAQVELETFGAAATVGRLGDYSPILLAIIAIVVGMLMLLLGSIIRRKAPKAAGYMRLFIPGCAKVLSPVAVIVCALFSAAFLALIFGMDRGVREVVLPRAGAIFEQGELVDTYLTLPSTWIAWCAALLTLHGVTIWLERIEKTKAESIDAPGSA